MDEVAQQLVPAEPADQSIAEAKHIADRDAKFARVAAENRARATARQAVTGRTGVESITAKVMAMATIPPRDQVIARITPEEGDQVRSSEIAPEILAAIVPARFTRVTCDTYKPMAPGQVVALDAVRQWTARAKAGGGAMLALIGPTGNGKTHLLYAAANALLGSPARYPIGCYARPWYKLANELRYGGESPFAPGRSFESSELRALLWHQRIVLLDEVRATAGTAFDDTELAMFACHAYDSRVSVLITSNVWPLSDVMGPPAASRFTQVVLDGPDWRQL